MDDKLLALLISSSVMVAIITFISNVVMWKLNRKAKLEDDHNKQKNTFEYFDKQINRVIDNQKNMSKEVETISEKLNNMTEGQMILLRKEIENEAIKYINKGVIRLEARRDIHDMYSIYHTKFNGNGGISSIMEVVDSLPVEE